MHDDDDLVDPLVAIRAGLDQALAMTPELARIARGHYDAFQGVGFMDDQALYLAACMLVQQPGQAPS